MAASNRLRVPPKTGQAENRRVQHAGQLDVGAEHLFAVQFVRGVQAFHRLANHLPFLGVLELDLQWWRQLGGLVGHGTECQGSSGGGVGNDAVGRGTFRNGNPPAACRRLDEHHARRRAAFAHILVALADAAAASGRKVLPHPVAQQVLAWGGVFPIHLGPVAFEFFRHHLRETRERALAHFRTGDADDDRIVRFDDDPGVDFVGCFGECGRHRGGIQNAQRQAGAGCGRPNQKTAPGKRTGGGVGGIQCFSLSAHAVSPRALISAAR